MGSEMCIRDRDDRMPLLLANELSEDRPWLGVLRLAAVYSRALTCLLYTSDAADERSSVDLGGRRIIKKKKSADFMIPHTHIDKRTSMVLYRYIS